MSLKYAIVVVVSLLITSVSIAQNNLSAVINVQFEGVEIRRQNSELWLPLPQSAVAFIGTGDTIRTDAQGRVDVIFDEDIHMLLLSNSDFTISTLASDDGALAIGGEINGNAVVEASPEITLDSFNLTLNDVTITQPAILMSIWSFPDVTDAVTVAQGTATVMMNDNEVDIPAEAGFLAEDERTEVVEFKPEWHAAGLEASLYGCEGVVKTSGNSTLLVRTGPGRGFQPMGTLDVSRIISLMGMTETTGWTRIQFLTGFGWIQSLAIESDCNDLPIISDDAPEEKFITIFNISDADLMLLQPFFKSPADNAFVYKFATNP